MISPLNVLLVSMLAYFVYNHYKTNLAPFINVSPVKTTLAKNTCEVIKGPVGCEDIVIPKGENFGIFACGQDILFKKIWGGSKYTALSKNPLKQEELDKFYHYDLETSKLIEIPVKNIPKDHTFGVHGFDMIADPKNKGNYLLYAVNHMRNSSETVEKFHYDSVKKELNWFGTEYGTPGSLINPNGLVFLDTDNYLVTGPTKYQTELMIFAQILGFFRGGLITHFSPSDTSIISESVYFANGIVASKDGKLLFVASSLDASIAVFKISKNKKKQIEFSYYDKILVDALPDNLSIDHETGDIFVAGMTSITEFIGYVTSPGLPTKDQNVGFRIIRIQIGKNAEDKDKYEFKTETVLEHDGTIHKMATVAAPHSKLNRVLIGTLFSDEVLNCKIN